jgi:hypothetical protein
MSLHSETEKRNFELKELNSIKKVIECLQETMKIELTGLTSNWDVYCSHDVDLTFNGNKNASLEVKNRHLTNQQLKLYINEGFVIEKNKFEYLISQLNPIYANYCTFEHNNGGTSELYLFWNLNKLKELKPFNMIAGATTEFENTTKKQKQSYLLDPKLAKVYVKHWGYVENEMPHHETKIENILKML